MTLEEATQKVEEASRLALKVYPHDPRVAFMLISTQAQVIQEMLEVLNIYNVNINLKGESVE